VVVGVGSTVVVRHGTHVIRKVEPSGITVGVQDLAPVHMANVPAGKAYLAVDVAGDYMVTVLIDGERTRVRMAGVDAPLVDGPDGAAVLPAEAARIARDLLVNEYVYLKGDPKLAEEDAEGNRVAYLYRAPEKLLLNLELVRQGYGLVADGYEFQYRKQFQAYEQKAQAEGRGVWGTLLTESGR
jgi:endonuclease YncB( thermonuclease family)